MPKSKADGELRGNRARWPCLRSDRAGKGQPAALVLEFDQLANQLATLLEGVGWRPERA